MNGYCGRFAPSPTGPLHAGSLVAALASWLDARAHGGRWLVRIEDVDTPRCVPGAAELILQQLAACGLVADQPPVWQSQRGALYQAALAELSRRDLVYPCGCSRKDIEQALEARGIHLERHRELIYPGTCSAGLNGKRARAWRLNVQHLKGKVPSDLMNAAQCAMNNVANQHIAWRDRRLGPQKQDVAAEVGDFVLKRADGLWAYQLAVVVDDAAQGVTHVVRGEDLTDNTARQILLQQCLQLPTPAYLHTPLVLGTNGEKLSKQNGATALDLADPLMALNTAAAVLGLPAAGATCAEALVYWAQHWRRSYNLPRD